MDSEEIYSERILDHYRYPRNKRIIKGFTHHAKDTNLPCGDEIEIYVRVKDGKIEDISFVGTGCAISQAAASMLMEKAKGKSIDDIKAMDEDYVINKLLRIPITYRRFGCATLALRTLKKAIFSDQKHQI